jgi:hypothetical protein
MYTNVLVAGTVNGDCVLLFEYFIEVVGLFFQDVLHDKIDDHKAEEDVTGSGC